LLRRGAIRTTVISRFELLSGAKNSKQLARLIQLLEAVPSLVLDDAAADAAGTLRRSLERSALMVSFAGLALVLSALGTYSVLSYSTGQRTREIGMRMALGAQRGNVLRLVVGSSMRLAIIGIAVGVAAALVLTQLITDLLFGVSATDPVTFGAVAVVLLASSLLASYIPARRAINVDPMVALRHE
jgi:putative ABC transport system permease protein